MSEHKRIVKGSLAEIGCEVLYGLSYLFTRRATEHASEFALLGWRFLVGFIFMSILAAAGIVKINRQGKPIRPLLLISMFCPCIYFLGETIGISHTTASESGVFLACIPVVSLIFSSLILKKKPSGIQVTGIVITLSGVIVTVLAAGISSSLSPVGYTFLVIGVISYSLYTVYVEKAEGYSVGSITYVMLATGAIFFIFLALTEAAVKGDVRTLIALPLHDRMFLSAILYQGIGCSVLAFLLSNTAVENIGVNRTSSFVGISTVVSIVAGALILKESFSAAQGVGAAIILAGVYIANITKRVS